MRSGRKQDAAGGPRLGRDQVLPGKLDAGILLS